MSPWSKTSTDGWRKTPRELSELFKMLPEDLFPVSLYVLEKTEAVIEVSIDSSLTYHPALMLESPETLYLRKEAEEETEGELHRLLSTLRPRYRGVLCDYYGVGGDGTRMTLVELGQKHNITGTRIRQMINISMKRLSQRVEGERLAREHNEHMKGAEGNNIN
jgi:DNA-directed RNA polymerase sigma subunit (sigma70/sigma32)